MLLKIFGTQIFVGGKCCQMTTLQDLSLLLLTFGLSRQSDTRQKRWVPAKNSLADDPKPTASQSRMPLGSAISERVKF